MTVQLKHMKNSPYGTYFPFSWVTAYKTTDIKLSISLGQTEFKQ